MRQGPTSIEALRANEWRELPSKPGVYWWYFPKNDFESFEIPSSLTGRLRKSRDGKRCLYCGITKNLRGRVRWHAQQKLTPSALRSGYLSTLRLTLLALNEFNYHPDRGEIDRFLDKLSLSWEKAPLSRAKKIEQSELGGRKCPFPLNIRGNKFPELKEYIGRLKSIRKKYREHNLSLLSRAPLVKRSPQ
jgi:hypothetical protein